jgi:hypothetical protein
MKMIYKDNLKKVYSNEQLNGEFEKPNFNIRYSVFDIRNSLLLRTEVVNIYGFI